jgi:hypothetical protein
VSVDITLTGRDSANEPLAMLIEGKHHGVPPTSRHDCLYFCTNGSPSLGYQPLASTATNPIDHPIVQLHSANFLTYYNDGVIWVDICRLMGAFQKIKKNTKPIFRLFQVFYIHQNFRSSFCNNLPEVYREYANIHKTSSSYADYVITEGIKDKVYHAWKAYQVKNFYCLEFKRPKLKPPGAPCCTVKKSDVLGGTSIVPFCSAHNYDLYLIEIQPF